MDTKTLANELIKTFKVIGLIIVAFLLFNLVSFETAENEYSVVKQFGKISTIKSEPGLSFKIPFIQTVNKIPKNKQFYDLPSSEVITSDKKTMVADAYIIWEVTDAKKFTSSLNASTSAAEGRIDVIAYNAIKTTISTMSQEELIISRDNEINVSDEHGTLGDVEINDIPASDDENVMTGEAEVIAISSRILECIGTQCDDYGLVIKDIQIKILDLPEENKLAVYNRMKTERNNIAAAYLAQGQAEADVIRNTTDKEVSILISEAEAEAAKIIGEGEAEYMKILSEAYNDSDKADFYLYVRALEAAKESLKNGNTTLFLDADSPIAQIFQ